MKIRTLFVAGLVSATLHAQSVGTDKSHRWLDSFEGYKANIRSLDALPKEKCESQLHDILKGIDDNAICSVDSDCTLLSQDPFGATVPVRAEKGKLLLSKMKQFKASCDNNSFHASQSIAAISVPACVRNRCMVRTFGGKMKGAPNYSFKADGFAAA